MQFEETLIILEVITIIGVFSNAAINLVYYIKHWDKPGKGISSYVREKN